MDRLKYAVSVTDEAVGINTPIMIHGSFEECFREAADCGYDGVELQIKNPATRDAGQLRTLMERYDLAIPAITSGMEYFGNGLSLIRDGMGILTHCNAGALATGGCGTALAPVYAAQEAGLTVHVFSDETRPLLQGARLTAWELSYSGIDVTTICDSMAAQVMREGRIQAVIVGADRVASNGDAANKIGTYAAAILAHYHKIPFYVAAPYSTFDMSLKSGADIPIEQRNSTEITEMSGKATAPEGVKTYNPAFDVTPHELIRAFITDRGVIEPPFTENLAFFTEKNKNPNQ